MRFIRRAAGVKKGICTSIAALTLLSNGISAVASPAPSAPEQPNVLVFLSDDVGYGDIGCYGGTGISTPNIDRLAAEGRRFTDAHSTSSTCTPSRYSLLTGDYSFRNPDAVILPGSAPLLIPPGSLTLPRIMKDSGYATGCIGKWHLGLGTGKIDWNGEIAPGPLEVGFDTSFIIPATPDRVPCVYVDGHKVAGLDPSDPISVSYSNKVGDDPTGFDHPEMLRYKGDPQHSDTIVDRISRIGWMSGGNASRWKDEDMATLLTQRAEEFITENKAKPFFLYFALNDIHVPHAPNDRFIGTSQCGIRGDSIEEMDWSMGEIVATLKRLKLTDKTLILFTSDNGPIVNDGYFDGSVIHLNGHKPAGPYRGGKYQIYEGGTRLPLIAFWPGHVKEGVSDALVNQVDFASSLAALIGYKMPGNAAVDSQNVLSALLGATDDGRASMVEQSPNALAIRSGNWKFIPGGVHKKLTVLEEGDKSQGPLISSGAQLYDLGADPAETTNVIQAHPDIAQRLDDLLVEDERGKATRGGLRARHI